MADLLDIAPSTACETVWIDGQRFSVRGVSLDAVASLVAKFPELRSLVNGGLGDDLVPRLIQCSGRAVGSVIAAGCGHLGDEAFERWAAQRVLGHQVKFLKAIVGLTFPNGIGSFAEDLTALIGGTGERAKPIKMRSKRSPSPSPDSSGTALRQTLQ
jgi:hypothetical protein